MKRVALSGYYGFGNLGDEALLRAIVGGLRRRVPDVDIVVASADPAATARLHGVRAVHRMDPRAWWSLLGRCDLFLSGGGSLLQDVTGPWSIPYYAGLMLLARLRRVPVMVFAQGIGPIRNAWGRALVRWAVGAAAAVTVRDAGSRELLRELGVTRPIEVVADPVFCLDVEDWVSLPARTATHGRDTLEVGIALRQRGLSPEGCAHLAAALDELARRRPVHYTFFAMQRPEDLTAARAVSARLTARHRVVDAALGLGDVATLIARCDLIVGMRLHALILAALLRRPLAGISYDPKVDEFLSQLGLTALATLPELPPPAELVRRLEDCLDQRERCRALLAERVPRLRAGAERAFEVAAQLLTSPASTPS